MDEALRLYTGAAAEQDLARRAVRGGQALAAQGITPQMVAAADAGNLPNVVLNLATSGSNVIIPAVAGQTIEVFAMFLWSVAQQTWELWDGSETLTGPMTDWPSTSGVLWPYTGEPYIETKPGGQLILALGAAGQVSGWIKYRRK